MKTIRPICKKIYTCLKLKCELLSNSNITSWILEASPSELVSGMVGNNMSVKNIDIYIWDLNLCIQLFQERLSENVHSTILKGIVGGFEFTVLQRNLNEWHKRPWTTTFLGIAV